jgi:hypothetical protein
MLARAAAFDRASGRDDTSIETTSRLIVGGMIGLIAGPLLTGSAFYARGIEVASVATVLSIFPVALGIDCILTGFKCRKRRIEAIRQKLDYVH